MSSFKNLAHLDDDGLKVAEVGSWSEEKYRLVEAYSSLFCRSMRRKWGSMSTLGTLTLAGDLTRLPHYLVEYVVIHELLHLVVARHGGMFELLLGWHLPDWRDREQELGKWAVWIGEGGLPVADLQVERSLESTE